MVVLIVSTQVEYLTFVTRGLIVSSIVPFGLWVYQLDAEAWPGMFWNIWFFTWITSILVSTRIKLNTWASSGTHAIFYLGFALVFDGPDWGNFYIGHAIFSACNWGIFIHAEQLYSRYKRLMHIKAHAQILEARIRPHFLFNMINNICALSKEPTVQKMLEDASNLFRHTLKRTSSLTPYEEERTFIEAYLRLEHMRLGDRLDFMWDIDDDVDDYNPLLPAFVLQPLIENAIYYGSEQNNGQIVCSLKKKGEWLYIQVSSPYGSQSEKRSGLHIATEDLKERVRILYDGHASVETSLSRDQKIYYAALKVPWTESTNITQL